jgi:hypothetical protein
LCAVLNLSVKVKPHFEDADKGLKRNVFENKEDNKIEYNKNYIIRRFRFAFFA